MNLGEVVRVLNWERRRAHAMSRVCDPVFVRDYERTATALRIASEIVQQHGDKHRRKKR